MVPGYRRIVNDVVIYSDDDHVHKFLQRCAEWKISLNPEKFEYGQEQVKLQVSLFPTKVIRLI